MSEESAARLDVGGPGARGGSTDDGPTVTATAQTRCTRCYEWNDGDPWYCPKCGKETTFTPHDGGHQGDQAEWVRNVE